nr:hypothetical protein [Tanacetum cinerariifolium]
MGRKKKFSLDLETFKDIFQIFPRVHGQDFDELPTDEVIVFFFKELGHTGEIKSITDVVVDQMHQPWRSFATIINRSLSGKTTGLDKLCLSRAQIIWRMYYKKNVDYVELIWEDFTYQINNGDTPGVFFMTTPAVGALVDFLAGLLTLFDLFVGSLVEARAVVSLGEAGFLNFLAFLGGLQASGPSEGANFELKDPDESKDKSSDTSEGTGVKPGVPDVSKADSSESDNES